MDKNLKFQFKSSYRSASAWIEKGKGLLISAEIINNELLQISEMYSNSIPDNLSLKFGGLVDSLHLLLGYAIENAIKGNIIAKKPDYNQISELNKYGFKTSKGHGIVEMVKLNIDVVSEQEIDLLSRLQESIIWAGRYNSPSLEKLENKKILSIHPDFKTDDFLNCQYLFKKIERSTNDLWNKNENLYYNWHDSNLPCQ